MDDRYFSNKVGGGFIRRHKIFEAIISLENLFSAWEEFKRGKGGKADVREFSENLEEHIFSLHDRLKNGAYLHGEYSSFFVHDPKLRHIHKATVLDRVLHQATMRVLEPIFEKTFIFDSYSSRKDKGVHRAVRRLHQFAWKVSKNNTRTVWALKCDIRKFFDSVDHSLLLHFLEEKIYDTKAMGLIRTIIHSFRPQDGKGIPLGNVTSQLFSNIFLNPLDQFLKRILRVKYYVRYADDFGIVSSDCLFLKNLVPEISLFLQNHLFLNLHPQKVLIRKLAQGVDFLGYVIFPHYRTLRAKTRQRMFKKLEIRKEEMLRGERSLKSVRQALMSYMGMAGHARAFLVKEQLRSFFRDARKDWKQD